MPIKIYGGGPNPPVRLDKWQNIVGVGWPDDDVKYFCLRYVLRIDDREQHDGITCQTHADRTLELTIEEIEELQPDAQGSYKQIDYTTFWDEAYIRNPETGEWSFAGGFVGFEDPSLAFKQTQANFDLEVVAASFRRGAPPPLPRWFASSPGTSTGISLPNPFGQYNDIDGFEDLTFDEDLARQFYLKGTLNTGPIECVSRVDDDGNFVFTFPDIRGPTNGETGFQPPTLREPLTDLVGSFRDLDFTGARITVGFDTYQAVATKLAGHTQLVQPSDPDSNQLAPGLIFVLFREVKESD